MRFRTQGRPTAKQLFRTTVVVNLTAIVFGVLVLWGCWAVADYDADVGREMRFLGTILVVGLGLATLLYYPWGPTWAAANGCKPEPENAPAPAGGRDG